MKIISYWTRSLVFNDNTPISTHSCYDLKLKLRLHLGKDLRMDKGCLELVKHKDYRVVSILYILISHEKSVHYIWVKWVIVHEAKARILHLLHEVLTEILAAQLIMLLCCTQEVSIITTPISNFFPSSEVATMWQTDGIAHKLKSRSFHKSAHLRVHSVNFHLGVNRAWHLKSIYITYC